VHCRRKCWDKNIAQRGSLHGRSRRNRIHSDQNKDLPNKNRNQRQAVESVLNVGKKRSIFRKKSSLVNAIKTFRTMLRVVSGKLHQIKLQTKIFHIEL